MRVLYHLSQKSGYMTALPPYCRTLSETFDGRRFGEFTKSEKISVTGEWTVSIIRIHVYGTICSIQKIIIG